MTIPLSVQEAVSGLQQMESDYQSQRSKSFALFWKERSFQEGILMDVELFVTSLVLVSASMDGILTEEEKAWLEEHLESDLKDASASDFAADLLYGTPPGVFFDAFVHQNVTKQVVLPRLLNHIRTIIGYFGRFNPREAEVFYEGLVESYEAILQKFSPAANGPAGRDAKIQSASAQTISSESVAALNRLHGLVGLDQIKAEVASMVDLIQAREIRRKHHLPVPDMTFHMVFSGNPGTGKTTVARILGDIYRGLGVLSKGQLVETDRSGLVGGYVGQTALKVREVVGSAMGGILFIDEAYTLADEDGESFGLEAIETLLKLMEDHRSDLIIIVAGYTKRMEKFLDSNPGLRSRFNKNFLFPDYSAEELNEIFRSMCRTNQYTLSVRAQSKARDYFLRIAREKSEHFANARLIRNYFERAVATQASRIVRLPSPTTQDLQSFLDTDLVE